MLPATPCRTKLGVPSATDFLWVGNSYFYFNNGLHSHVGALSRAADKNSAYRAVSVTISGSGLSWHDMHSYFRPDGIGGYSTVENEVVFHPRGRRFDAVIMMDNSQGPTHPMLRDRFHRSVSEHSRVIIEHGARPVLFMSWAYKDRPAMTQQLAEQYTLAGNVNDALVIPAGLAFSLAVARRPDVDLYQPDGSHPSLSGTYLAACVAYAALFQASPAELDYSAGIEREIALFLQSIAQETVRDYFGVATPAS